MDQATEDLRSHRVSQPTHPVQGAREALGEPEAPVFQPGQIVAQRFRIVAFLAKGGMGEVYEAEDTVLKESVALKTIRPEIALDPATLRRFTREITLSRKVTHPNVCRVFDLFQEESRGQIILLLSMELLRGDNLKSFIRQHGSFTPEEALPFIQQMASALGAAHQAGIVHRDFKPQNVVLMTNTAFPGGIRAVVTDFGLAHGFEGENADQSITVAAEGFFVGTPAYMAPEQVLGQEVTPRSDIYSLGLVIYEMLVGQVAFSGTNALSVATARLTEPAPDLLLSLPQLDRRWGEAISRCLERDASRRWTSVDELLTALSATFQSAEMDRQSWVSSWKRRLPVLAVSLAALGGLGLMVWMAQRSSGGKTLVFHLGSPARVSVAVLAFRNLKPDEQSAWIATALSEMISTELAAGEGLRVIPGEVVARARRDLGIPSGSAHIPSEVFPRIYQNLGSEYLVTGNYLSLKGKLRVTVEVKSQSNPASFVPITREADESEVFSLVESLSKELRVRLDLKAPAVSGGQALASALPIHPEARRLYILGLEKLRNHEGQEARKYLERALQLEPSHSLTHSNLARALLLLGYEKKAQDHARRAFELANSLPKTERLLVEARLHRLSNEWAKAIAIYQELVQQQPDNLTFGLELVNAQRNGNQAQQALATLERLRKLPEPDSKNPLIDYEESTAHSQLGSSEAQRQAAVRAAQKAQTQGARWLLGMSRIQESDALQKQEKWEEAKKAIQAALEVMLDLEDKDGIATARSELGWIHALMGSKRESRQEFESALAVYEEIGNLLAVARVQNNMANLEFTSGSLDKARDLFQKAVSTFKAMDMSAQVVTALTNLAEVESSMGLYQQSQDRLEEALSIARSLPNQQVLAQTLRALGHLLSLRGQASRASETLEEAVALSRTTQAKSILSDSLGALALHRFYLGDISRGQRALQEAQSMRTGMTSEDWCHSLNGEAECLLSSGDPKGSMALFQKMLERAQSDQNELLALKAQMGIGRCQQQQGLLTELTKTLTTIQNHPSQPQDYQFRFHKRMLEATLKKPDQLRSLADEARQKGSFVLWCQASLEWARLLSTQGKKDQAAASFQQLQREATQKGYLAWAQGKAVVRH